MATLKVRIQIDRRGSGDHDYMWRLFVAEELIDFGLADSWHEASTDAQEAFNDLQHAGLL